MHPNPAFREEDQARALVAARERGFGILTVVAPEGTEVVAGATNVPATVTWPVEGGRRA